MDEIKDIEVTNDIDNHKKSISGKHVFIIFFIFMLFAAFFVVRQYKNLTLDSHHIYVADNPKHLSEFETWIREEVSVTWVPSYIVVHNGYIIGAFNGDISESEFTDTLATTIALDMPYMEMSDLEISNIYGERKPANEVFNDEFCIIEYVWVDCPDCEHQDDNYTRDIYKKYSTNCFYRYYVKSDINKVKDKHNIR